MKIEDVFSLKQKTNRPRNLASEKNENKQRIQKEKEENKDKKVFCGHVEKQTNNSLKANQIKETARRRERDGKKERETGRKKERKRDRERK